MSERGGHVAGQRADKDDCDCHCEGEFHGMGLSADEPAEKFRGNMRERIAAGKAALRNRRDAKHLRGVSDDELNRYLHRAFEADDQAAIKNLAREADRRDRTERARGKRRSEAVEFESEIERQYLAAEEATNGYMVNKKGQRAGIDPKTLWEGSEARARKYASEELLDYWDGQGDVKGHRRYTLAEQRRQLAKDRAAQEESYQAEHGPYAHLIHSKPDWGSMSASDFDAGADFELFDEKSIRSAQPQKAKAPDAFGTTDMFG